MAEDPWQLCRIARTSYTAWHMLGLGPEVLLKRGAAFMSDPPLVSDAHMHTVVACTVVLLHWSASTGQGCSGEGHS
jgi:hypothetical protein